MWCRGTLSARQRRPLSSSTWVHLIIEVPPLVHPHFGHAHGVLDDDVADAAGERVGRLVPEHVTDARARNDLQLAAALPDL